MEDRYWIQVGIDTTTEGLEQLSAWLYSIGITGLMLEDETDFEDFLENNKDYWDYVDDELLEQKRGVTRAVFYVTQDEDGLARLAEVEAGLKEFRARCDCDPGTLAISRESLREEDWATNWKNYYHPLTAGEKLYIVPEWERGAEIPEGRTPVFMNPGLIFGSGSHASTQLCLAGLETIVKPGDRVLDLGCGSGILAIAALCLGADSAVGCDIDPKAGDIVMENAAFNGIDEKRLTVYTGNVLSDEVLQAQMDGSYQAVFANIVADVIIPLSAIVSRYMAPGAKFLCSGIIDTRAEEVAAALVKNGFRIVKTESRSDWYFYMAERA